MYSATSHRVFVVAVPISLCSALAQVLGCIGEVLDESGDIISGVAVNIRKREDRVAIWTRTSDPAKVG